MQECLHQRQLNDDDSGSGWWTRRVSPPAKLILVLCLIASFIAQTALVYTDPPTSLPLSAQGQAGRRLWLRRNCQTCHQFYGFGGFLGPDLTNASSRVTNERLKQILTVGAGVMPAFHLSTDQIASIGAFLEAMNQTGRGQAIIDRADRNKTDVRSVFFRVVQSEFIKEHDAMANANDQARVGFELLQVKGCMQCHNPFSISSVGAPGLTTISRRFGRQDIMTTLENGKPPQMPAPMLDSNERESVYLFLSWMTNHRDRLLRDVRDQARQTPFRWTNLPWWEFSR